MQDTNQSCDAGIRAISLSHRKKEGRDKEEKRFIIFKYERYGKNKKTNSRTGRQHGFLSSRERNPHQKYRIPIHGREHERTTGEQITFASGNTFLPATGGNLPAGTWKIAAADSGKSGYNLFMKINMAAFKPDGKIGDFSLLQLSEGVLQKVNHLSAVADSENTVTLTWENDANIPSARATDRLIVVVLHENRSFSPTAIEEILAIREDERATFRLNRQQGTTAHLYCFFKAKDGKAYSPSQYLRI